MSFAELIVLHVHLKKMFTSTLGLIFQSNVEYSAAMACVTKCAENDTAHWRDLLTLTAAISLLSISRKSNFSFLAPDKDLLIILLLLDSSRISI